MRTFGPGIAFGVFVTLAVATEAGAADDLGLKVAEGFRVTMISDEALANDIYAMTLDSRGRVVVTSRGHIKTLHDDDGDGKADRATVFAETETGGMGLCFVGNDLFFCGDGWLSRYRDANGDGRADGPAEHLFPLAFAEHGGHAMRKGPDGWLYMIGGNDAGIDARHATIPGAGVAKPEAGAVLRISPDGRRSGVFAHGFRNPYDFDFGPDGDLFTYDSDVERDAFLPWYLPTRLYHVAQGGHHGWRLKGYLRSWPRPGYDPATVPPLRIVGRGSPTGVTVYRHTQFPERYRGGLFYLDWTFGKVYFSRLEPRGSTYSAEPEVFLEPTGTHGFAPTDVAVAPDGSLFISIGGRRTRGAVYRVEALGRAADDRPVSTTDLDRVLTAAQPLDAWSRATWEPLAARLGPGPFLAAARDETRAAGTRVRAIEVVTELFAGLPADDAKALTASGVTAVRDRLAWSLGSSTSAESREHLLKLADDSSPRVRLAAIDALSVRAGSIKTTDAPALDVLVRRLGDDDRRVQQSAVLLVNRLDGKARDVVLAGAGGGPLRNRLGGLIAACSLDDTPRIDEKLAEKARLIFEETTDADLRLAAVRLIIRSLGDYHWNDPPVEVLTAYTSALSLDAYPGLTARLKATLRARFPTNVTELDQEIGRVLAMLGDDAPGLLERVAALWTLESPADRDFHNLVVFSRLKGPRTPDLTSRTADAVVGLDQKLGGQAQRVKQTWNMRLVELVRLLREKDSRLSRKIAGNLISPTAGNVTLALALEPEDRRRAAVGFSAALSVPSDLPWSAPLVALLAESSAREVKPMFRKHWSDYALRGAILIELAKEPSEDDRAIFLDALDLPQTDLIPVAIDALRALPRDDRPQNLVAPLRLLRRLCNDPREWALRGRTLSLIERQAIRVFGVKEVSRPADAAKARALYQPVFEWFATLAPELAKTLTGQTDDLASLKTRLAGVDWSKGDAARGAKLFETRGCLTCHAGARALGPDLTGVSGRLSRDDLFAAIAFPNLDVAPAYRTTAVATRDGLVYNGVVAFESADGLILQTGAATTVRVANEDIVERRSDAGGSLMPENLMKDMSPDDYADLDAYLRRPGVAK